jgi:muramoyltetrapeptide carboxypeptidase LdcA involved in peptidoglycan recycling
MYVMLKMKLMGLFDDASAVIFGRTFLPGEASDMDYLELLERVFAGTGVPLIWNADIGHTKPSFTIINGAMGHLTFENGRASLSMELL